jgi:hypothetical protein
MCGNNRICATGGCGDCGRVGQQRCNNVVGCTADFVVNQNGMCVPCGGSDQTCCNGAGGGGWCATPFACTGGGGGTCQVCGGDGQPCCPGSYCPTSTNRTCGGNDRCQ